MKAGTRTLRPGLALAATALALTATACGSSKSTTTAPAAAGKSSSSTMPASGGSGMPMSSAAKSSAVTCGSAPPGSKTMAAGSHRFILSVGPSETMYSSQAVHKMHPRSGEIMLGGHMQGMSNMSGGSMMSGTGGMRHLEVHICTRQGDKVVTGPPPTITLTAGNKPEMLPVAEMEGIGEGMKDYHFGNNVQMMKGTTYTVDVREASDHVVFHLTPG